MKTYPDQDIAVCNTSVPFLRLQCIDYISQASKTTLQEFFSAHPVFTHEELVAFLRKDKVRSAKTRDALLAYHQKQDHILRVRRGLYCVVPPGAESATCPVDVYLLAAKMTDTRCSSTTRARGGLQHDMPDQCELIRPDGQDLPRSVSVVPRRVSRRLPGMPTDSIQFG